MTETHWTTETVNVEKIAGAVHVDSRRLQRNLRRNNATMQAAVRLAHYRLRKFIRDNELTTVDDTNVHVADDYMRNAKDVWVTVRTIRLPPGITNPNICIPPGTSVVRFAVPADNHRTSIGVSHT